MDYFITTKCPYNYETTTTEKIIMTTQDIMIGDWVKDGNVYAQVTAITCDGIIETTHNPHSNIELIEPIPLTAEILKENEFVKAVENEHGCNYLLLIPTGYIFLISKYVSECLTTIWGLQTLMPTGAR